MAENHAEPASGPAPHLPRHLDQVTATLEAAKRSLNEAESRSALNGVPAPQRASLRSALGRLDSVVAQLAGRVRLLTSADTAVAQEAEAQLPHDLAQLAAEVDAVTRLVSEMQAQASGTGRSGAPGETQ